MWLNWAVREEWVPFNVAANIPKRPETSRERVLTDDEIAYLCRVASGYFARPVEPSQVVWTYSGVRPLYDDDAGSASAVTRDYVLELDATDGRAPLLSVFGGKITTYRRLAEHALEKLAPYFPALKPPWTAQVPLPGSDFASREAAKRELAERYRELPPAVLQGVFRRHGTAAADVLGDGRLGEDYGAGLTEREVAHFLEREWACSAEDVLWRRSKCGLHMTQAQCARVAQVVGR